MASHYTKLSFSLKILINLWPWWVVGGGDGDSGGGGDRGPVAIALLITIYIY